MKILIEDAETLEYLTPRGHWTKSSVEAAGYPSSATAKIAGAKAPIGRFNIIGSFANSPQITNLDDGCGTSPKN